MSEGMRLLPAKPGTCAFCATKHDENMAHNLHSMFYQVRFKMKWKREPTWADAVAHLQPEIRKAWRDAVTDMDDWSEPADGEPIVEPYAMSDPCREGF